MPFSRVRLSAAAKQLAREARSLPAGGRDSIFYATTLLTTGNPDVRLIVPCWRRRA